LGKRPWTFEHGEGIERSRLGMERAFTRKETVRYGGTWATEDGTLWDRLLLKLNQIDEVLEFLQVAAQC
jgi:hypothetical protein